MKKVEKVSIAGISFSLDEDAYVSLREYLGSLHKHYDGDPDGGEITADIEARIAELILDEQVYTKVVSRELVDTIIAQLGSAEQIDDDPETDGAPAWSVGSSGGSGSRAGGFSGTLSSGSGGSIPRRLYRTDRPRVLGGVCGGIARYFNINVLWVRLVFLVPLIADIFFDSWDHHHFHGIDELGGWTILAYIILWIALPTARTPRQQLEARGESVTADSIRQSFNSAATTPTAKRANSVAAEILIVVGRIVLFFVKFVAACVAFGVLVAAMAIIVSMIAILVHPWASFPDWMSGLGMVSPLAFTELVLFCVMMPLLLVGIGLVLFTLGHRRSSSGRGRGWRFGAIGAWLAAVVFLVVVMIGNSSYLRDRFWDGRQDFHIEFWDDDDRRERHDDNEEWRREVRRVETLPDSVSTPDPVSSGGAAADSLSVDLPDDGDDLWSDEEWEREFRDNEN